jgi:hypothetical protein
MNNERLKTEIKRHLAIASAKALPNGLRQKAKEKAKQLEQKLIQGE